MSAASGDTLHEVLRRGRERLIDGGFTVETAGVDVEVLARHLLACDRATLLLRRRETAPDGFEGALSSVLTRRLAREPVAYITGHREFWGLDFEVTADVLVPRPETELVVEEALEILGSRSEPTVLDVGTGSGCLAIAIAAHAPDARVVAIDLSVAALRVAQRNAARLAPQRVRFVAGDLLAPFGSDAFVDVLVANPPYVPRAATNVMLDVARHEPSMALFSGADGLGHLRRLARDAARVVRAGGWLITEFGDGQDDAVSAIVSATEAWSIERVRLDLQQIPRVLVARRT